jgi:hypothetical protein
MRRIVEEHTDPPERLDRAINQRAAMPGFGDVTRRQHACAPGRLDEALRLPRVLLFVEIADEEISALARKGDR